MKDEVIAEIRAIRREIEAESGNDPDAYLRRVYQAQKEHGDRLVRLAPKPPRKRQAKRSEL